MQTINSSRSKILFADLSLLAMVAAAWGLSWPIMKILMSYQSPLWLGAIRMAIGSACLFVYLLMTKQYQRPRLHDMRNLLTVGLLFMGFFTACITMGLLHLGAGRSVILVYSTPMWVTPMAILFFKEKLTVYKTIGLLLSVLGIDLLFNPLDFDWHKLHFL